MSDIIEKHIVLKAALDRVWAAIADSAQFGTWFGVRFDGPFEAGKPLHGVIVPTAVNDEIAAHQKPYEGTPFQIKVETIAPHTLFSFRWHPYAIDKTVDYSDEPMTLVTFALKEVADGVHLTITESGFENLSPQRRAEAFPMNEGGWQAQTGLIKAYVEAYLAR